jgi:hypothetical protein
MNGKADNAKEIRDHCRSKVLAGADLHKALGLGETLGEQFTAYGEEVLGYRPKLNPAPPLPKGTNLGNLFYLSKPYFPPFK